MAIKIGIGISAIKDPVLAVREAARRAQSDIAEEKIDLGIIFNTVELSRPELLAAIAGNLGDIPIIGCSSMALISQSGILAHGVIIMLLRFLENAYFSTACVKEINKKTSLAAGLELGEKLLYGFKNVRRDFGIIFADGKLEENSGLIPGLQERLGKSFPLAGGCASGAAKTYVYFNQELLTDAACGILLGGKIYFSSGTKHGWKPLGKPRQVTRSEANIVYTIDSKPAVEIYQDYLAAGLERLRKELKYISVLYPIGISLPGEEEYLLRNLLAIRDDGALVLQSNIPQGSRIRLMIGTKESCLAATRAAAQEVKNGLLGRSPNFVLVFNSISRYILLGRRAEEEIKVIKDVLGADTRIIGLYTSAEQAPSKAIDYQGLARLHNQTMTIMGVSA